MSGSTSWSPAVLVIACLLLLPAPARSQMEGLDGDVYRNLDYVSEAQYPNDWNLLDVFMPEGAEAVPVIVFFHGGSLRAGDKSQGEYLAARLVPEGVGVVSANYRLTPAVMHPAHVQDAAAAFAWVARNIERYGGDPDNVYIAGHSAGAYLAALLALDPDHLAKHGLGPESFRASIPISAFFFVEETARDRPKDVWGEDPDAWLRASVTPHIGPGQAPMLLIYADGDDEWRREQHDRLGELMQAAGNADVAVLEVPRRNHMSLMTEITAEDDRIGEAVMRFIRHED